jgi:hypothetical protein
MKKTIVSVITALLILSSSALAMNVDEEIQVVDTHANKAVLAVPTPTPATREEPKCNACCGYVCQAQTPPPTPTPTPKPKPRIIYRTIDKKSEPIIIKKEDSSQPIMIYNNNINNNIINPQPTPVATPVPQLTPQRVVEERHYYSVKKAKKDNYTNSDLYLYGGFTQIRNIGGEYEFRGHHWGIGLFFENDTIDTRNSDYDLIKGYQGGLDVHYHFQDRDVARRNGNIQFGLFAQAGGGKYHYAEMNDFGLWSVAGGADVEIPIYEQFAFYIKVDSTFAQLPDHFYHTGENVALGVKIGF